MRLLFFFIVTIAALYLPFSVVLILFMLYVAKYPGYELILLGFLIDAQFGGDGYGGALYTASATALVILGMLVKPNLRAYDSV